MRDVARRHVRKTEREGRPAEKRGVVASLPLSGVGLWRVWRSVGSTAFIVRDTETKLPQSSHENSFMTFPRLLSGPNKKKKTIAQIGEIDAFQ